MGPVASQVAITELGTNGGGVFNANSAHPVDTPAPLAHLREILLILLTPAGRTYTGGIMVGYGAFTATSFKRDQEVVLDANPQFYGEKAKVGRIVIRYFADATTLRLALDKGEIDLAYKTLNPSDIVDESKNPKVNTLKLDGAFIRYVAFETSEGVFKDKVLRQAFAFLINRPEIIQKVYLGQNKPLYSMIPNGMEYQLNSFKGMEANVAKADALLTKAGFSKAKPFEFDLWYTTSHYGDTEINQAEVLKAQLEKSSLVKVTIKSAEWATYKSQWKKKQMPVYLPEIGRAHV